jgi:hypothetical protein
VSIEFELQRARVYLDLWLQFRNPALLERARECMRAVNAVEQRRNAVTVRPMRLAA